MRPAPRIPRSVPKGKRAPNGKRSAQHLAFVRALGICLACGRQGHMEAMHVRAGTDGGIGMKPGDRYTVPGCHECHVQQHQIGELSFWSALGIDPLNISLRLWTVS